MIARRFFFISAGLLCLMLAVACDIGPTGRIFGDGDGGSYAPPPGSPVISSVQWSFTTDCELNGGGTMTLVVVVNDPDTPADSLSLVGASTGAGKLPAVATR